ncbi:MAG: hypothetical protein QOE96_2159 [Blastocatellia bacterium]|nr:hypothetical protein [Blastocatellia bacterium]
MKRAIVTTLIVFLLGGIGVISIRPLLRRQSPQTAPAKPASQPVVIKTNTVSYGGVSFTFDQSLAKGVKAETIPAMTDSKPSDIVPEHPAFTLVDYPRPRSMPENDPEIRVFSITKFRDAMHQASMEMAKTTIPPTGDWGPDVDEEVRVLRILLEKMPAQGDLKSFISKVRDPSFATMGNDYPQMAFLPFWEATQAFISHLKYVNFKNGKGVFFLTQWDTETAQITNEGLEYAFQGITNDGQYYVYAEFSVGAPFLPKGDEPNVVAWDEKNYLLLHKSNEYQHYLRPVLTKLEALPANKFQPNLELLEQLIRSLEVQDD